MKSIVESINEVYTQHGDLYGNSWPQKRLDAVR